MCAQVWDQVWAQVGVQVRAQVADQVWDQVWDQVRAQLFGSHDAGWLSCYAYCADVLRLQSCDRLRGLIEVGQCCGWWAPYRRVAILQHRHCELHRDTAGRLHNATGMAVKYRDGWGVYAWHGVRVSADIIEHPEKITPTMIEQQTNAEIRRVMIERYGFDRYLRDGGFRLVQQDDFGKLYRRSFADEPDIVLVSVVDATPQVDGTARRYVLPVPSRVRTAHEAVASSFGLEVDAYHPAKES